MKWATREHVHLDRVACAWLIQRLIDPAAEFVFVPWAAGDDRPADAIPFALPGAELGPHDQQGTTFEKIIRKYQLDDPALKMMGAIIASGVHQALHRGQPDEFDVPQLEGIGLGALAEGLMLTTDGDHDTIDKSMRLYDALYAYCRAGVLTREDPTLRQKGFLERTSLLKNAIRASRPFEQR